MENNDEVLELDAIDLETVETIEGNAQKSVRFEQRHIGIPVYVGSFVVSARKDDDRIVSAVNGVVYDISRDLGTGSVSVGG